MSFLCATTVSLRYRNMQTHLAFGSLIVFLILSLVVADNEQKILFSVKKQRAFGTMINYRNLSFNIKCV